MCQFDAARRPPPGGGGMFPNNQTRKALNKQISEEPDTGITKPICRT